MAEAAKKQPETEKPAADAGRPWPDQANAGANAKPLAESRWSLLEHRDPGHWICLERGTPYEQVFVPSFWANVAMRAKFEIGQTVQVRNDEMTVFATLIVLETGRNWTVMGEYYKRTRDEIEKSRPPMRERSKHIVQFAGPVLKWRVLREGDNAEIKANFASEALARSWLTSYEQTLGR